MMRRAVAVGLALLVAHAACAQAPAPPNSSSSPARAPLSDASEPGIERVPSVVPRSRHIQCGNASCTAGREICCTIVDANAESVIRSAACVAPPVSADPRFLACPAAVRGDDRVVGLECDDSAGCRDDEVCCGQMFGSGQPEQVQCKRRVPGRRFVCDFGEHCVEGSACRTPDSVCKNARCEIVKHAHAPIDCGGHACGGATPVCCLRDDKLACVATGTCADALVECTRPSDCERGQFCGSMAGLRTICTSFQDGNIPRLCTKDADCAGWMSDCKRTPCEPRSGRDPWRTCGCVQ